MSALAERSVACKGFRWMPGMRAIGTLVDGAATRVCVATGAEILCGPDAWDDHQCEPAAVFDTAPHWIPDLNDPATLGCFEHGLLPDAWDDPWFAVVADSDGRWRCTGSKDYHGLYGYESKAEAIVAAMEAAPS
jgi:hypothetical protein